STSRRSKHVSSRQAFSTPLHAPRNLKVILMSESEDVCPVCGQEYVHTRDVSDPYEHDLRGDFTECRREMDIPNSRGTVFVHEPSSDVDVTRETVVKHVNRHRTLGEIDPVGERKIGLSSQNIRGVGEASGIGNSTSGINRGGRPYAGDLSGDSDE
ncbi:hypothetical protein, partial [Halobacterium hubeiense]|uniref:hypothetical protein n=1 Tax=Halobacterium hubeiense TaxID=1407499 RepID=UPI003C76538C